MIDQGSCFNGGEWSFPDSPLRGLYAQASVYDAVTDIGSFDPWLGCVEGATGGRLLDAILEGIPPEWYKPEGQALSRLLDRLWARRPLVPSLILSCKATYRRPFRNWK